MGLLDSFFGGGDSTDAWDAFQENFPQSPALDLSSQYGNMTWNPGRDGGRGAFSFQLNPEWQQRQGSFFGMSDDIMQYLSDYNPEDAANKRYSALEAMQQPSRDRALSRLQDRLNLTGREGFASGVGTALGVQMSPEMAAYYESLFGQQQANALQSHEFAQNQIDRELGRASGALNTGFSLMNPLYQEAGIAQGFHNPAQNYMLNRSQVGMGALQADAEANNSGGLFGQLLNTALPIAANYFLPGIGGTAASAAIGALGSSGNSIMSPSYSSTSGGTINNNWLSKMGNTGFRWN